MHVRGFEKNVLVTSPFAAQITAMKSHGFEPLEPLDSEIVLLPPESLLLLQVKSFDPAPDYGGIVPQKYPLLSGT